MMVVSLILVNVYHGTLFTEIAVTFISEDPLSVTFPPTGATFGQASVIAARGVKSDPLVVVALPTSVI